MKSQWNILWILPTAVLLLSQGMPLPAPEIYVCRHASIHFFSSAPIEDIEARTDQAVSAINSANNAVYFKVPIRSFEFDKSLMQEHFNENFMESDQYPYATFKGTLSGSIDWTRAGHYRVTAKGTLSIHGVSKQYVQNGQLTIAADTVRLAARFRVRLADHHIAIPRILFNNIAEEVAVNVHAIYLHKKMEQ